jgi:sortase A
MTAGRVLLSAGVLVLLFIAYLLWGTGLITAQAQHDLRQEFAAAQRSHHESVAVHPPSGPTGPPSVAPPIAAPAPGGPVGIISIPKISLSMAIVEGTDAEQLRSGPGHYPGTPLPGEAGNVAIAGHRTTYLHPFFNLNELANGDAIDILTVQGLFVYKVTSNQAVSPSDVAVVAPTATPVLTLTTCNPRYSASQRLVVQAALIRTGFAGDSLVWFLRPRTAEFCHGSRPRLGPA